MSAVIFSGLYVKTLKGGLNINDNSYILSGTVNPSTSATSAPIGSLYLNSSTGKMYRKLDAGSSTNWVLLETPGGPSMITWDEFANAPIQTVENNYVVYKFETGLSQELYTSITVPDYYSPGSQIKLQLLACSPGTSGNILLRSQSTLTRSETDDYPTTTNQRTSTNSAITMSASNDTKPQKLSLDLTSSTGTVNSVAVSAQDQLMIRLYRDTDTDTSDITMFARSGRIIWS